MGKDTLNSNDTCTQNEEGSHLRKEIPGQHDQSHPTTHLSSQGGKKRWDIYAPSRAQWRFN
jgi:hypothetical protein